MDANSAWGIPEMLSTVMVSPAVIYSGHWKGAERVKGIIMVAYADVLDVLCDSLSYSFQGKPEETNAALEEESAEKASLQSSLVEATDEIQAKEQMLEESNSQTLTLRSAMAELKQEAQEMAVEAQAAAVSAAAELRAANENAVKVNADLEKERKRSR